MNDQLHDLTGSTRANERRKRIVGGEIQTTMIKQRNARGEPRISFFEKCSLEKSPQVKQTLGCAELARELDMAKPSSPRTFGQHGTAQMDIGDNVRSPEGNLE